MNQLIRGEAIIWLTIGFFAYGFCVPTKGRQNPQNHQQSSGDNSPNIIGNRNNVVINNNEAPPSPSSVAIFADCKMMSGPVLIPPKSSINVLPLNQTTMQHLHSGLDNIPNRTDKTLEWPSKQIQDSIRDSIGGTGKLDQPFWHMGMLGYRCDVSNHSRLDVLDVTLTFRFWYGDALGENGMVTYSPILSPIDAGSDFVFYVFNNCPVQVGAVLVDQLTLTVPGESAQRSLPLYLRHRNTVEPFMILTPSSIPWVSPAPCK